MSQRINRTKTKISPISISLRLLRGSRKQAEFARFLGIKNQQTYQRYESGRVPRADLLQRFASKLGVSLDTLLAPQPSVSLFRNQDKDKLNAKFTMIARNELRKMRSLEIEKTIHSFVSALSTLPKPARGLLKFNIQLLIEELESRLSKTNNNQGLV